MAVAANARLPTTAQWTRVEWDAYPASQDRTGGGRRVLSIALAGGGDYYAPLRGVEELRAEQIGRLVLLRRRVNNSFFLELNIDTMQDTTAFMGYF